MKKWIAVLLLGVFLTGCSAQTFETVGDVLDTPVMGQSKQILMELPEDAAVGAVNTQGGKVYWCEDYDITVQTLQGGDVARTVKTLSGFDMDRLTVFHTQNGDSKRYEWVWSSAGETGDQISRAVIIAEGNYHYCVTLHTAAEAAGALEPEWTAVLATVQLGQ